jgi:hypothetical protein
MFEFGNRNEDIKSFALICPIGQLELGRRDRGGLIVGLKIGFNVAM